MKKASVVAVVLLAFFAPVVTDAIWILDFPGVEKLIDMADAIVILRVVRDLEDPDARIVYMTPYRTYKCYVYQTLKGDIPNGTRMKLELMDVRSEPASPYALSSTHLMFLVKEQKDDEPAEYRTLPVVGANIELSPFGHENPPKGATIEEQIRNLIKDAIAYRATEHEKNQKFLKNMLGKDEASEPTD